MTGQNVDLDLLLVQIRFLLQHRHLEDQGAVLVPVLKSILNPKKSDTESVIRLRKDYVLNEDVTETTEIQRRVSVESRRASTTVPLCEDGIPQWKKKKKLY